MENSEQSTSFYQNNLEKEDERKNKGVRLDELISREGIEIDKSMDAMLKLMLEQNDFLSHVEVVTISPEDEPNTDGFFHRVQVGENVFIPTIFIVSENKEHLQKLKDVRESSAKEVADMLGISFENMTPNLLRQFIIAHELGHATDYIKNYETNPDFEGADAAEEWSSHYNANLYTLPVPGFDPVDLREEMAKFTNLEEFLLANPDVYRIVKTSNIKTLQDLLNAQELAYRNSSYENYADNFATDFLKKNAKELKISELVN
ncbi:MAG: hypothetical protein L3J07_01965 [Candidatus Magasanikbacteria bacterium]|nr:hypothetical protein [Candidatus Magasanikbacteria bacterium]